MRARIENGCVIITDVYEPPPIKRTRYSAFAGRVFIFLCAMAVVGGVLWGLSDAMP